MTILHLCDKCSTWKANCVVIAQPGHQRFVCPECRLAIANTNGEHDVDFGKPLPISTKTKRPKNNFCAKCLDYYPLGVSWFDHMLVCKTRISEAEERHRQTTAKREARENMDYHPPLSLERRLLKQILPRWDSRVADADQS
jgi:hypothetical protein